MDNNRMLLTGSMMASKPNLQPCPRCGGTPVPGCVNYGHHFIDSMGFDIECPRCGLWTKWCRKPQEAVDAWNEMEETE